MDFSLNPLHDLSNMLHTASTPAPENRLFRTRPSGAMIRDYDSEVNLLEEVAKRLPSDARGTIS
jgi:hypothetical protein